MAKSKARKRSASSKGRAAKSKALAKRDAEPAASGIPKAWGEIMGVALLAISGLIGFGVYAYQFSEGQIMGEIGELVGYSLYSVFGMLSYVLALGIFWAGVRSAMGRGMELRVLETVGYILATLCACLLLSYSFPHYRLEDGQSAGGLVGEVASALSEKALGWGGTYLLGIAGLCLGLLAATPLQLAHLTRPAKWLGSVMWESLERLGGFAWDSVQDLRLGDVESSEVVVAPPERKKSKKKKRSPKKEKKDSKGDAVNSEDAAADIGEGIDLEQAPEPERPAAATKGKRSSRKNKKKSERPADVAALPDPEQPREEPPYLEAADFQESPLPPEIVVSEELDEPAPIPEKKAAKPSAPVKPPALATSTPAGGGTHPVHYLKGTYELPPLELFGALEVSKVEVDRDFVLAQAQLIEESLAHFRIRGKVTKVHPGPVITRYEFKPEAGVKLSKIENLENDLAMALEAIRIRILAPIPGTSCVGFEVPNKGRETVYVQEVMGDPSFVASKARLPLVLGKNITGKPVSIDLAKAPHLLVAGATGSGKSVGVNCMLCSLLHSCSPEDLRMILIDPKMLEFSVYGGIPHLLLPVITDADRANLALRWVVKEMDRRYKVLSQAKVRDILGYNTKLPTLQDEWEAEKRALELEAQEAAQAVREEGEEAVSGRHLSGRSFTPDGQAQISFGGVPLEERPEKMPYIVVVVDEFADLMMVASKEVEANVARIAAKARAAGIHLIVATQRPSVDVITGTIKNNFPSRIAFQVTSDVDSRTILDQKGAKQLLGMGDMLYMDRGKEPARVHGCFVSEKEIEKVVSFVSKQARPAYNMEITAAVDEAGGVEGEEQNLDPLYDRAVQLVAEAQKVSTSMIQRRLSIGYNRAAKIVESMEENGVVGPPRGSQGREVLISAA